MINLIDPIQAIEVAKHIAVKLPDQRAQTFFIKNVARWLRRRRDCMFETHPKNYDPHWAIQAARRGDEVHRFKLSNSALQNLNTLNAWILALLDDTQQRGQAAKEAQRTLNGLHAMSVNDALRRAAAWHKADQARQENAPPRGANGYKTTPLYKVLVSNGFIWEKLPVGDLPFLGYDLLNCMRAGKYQRDVSFRILSVWGLRDPNSNRFVAALTTPGQSHSILGVRGFRNSYPIDYKCQIRDFMKVLRSPPCDTPDLRALGFYPR